MLALIAGSGNLPQCVANAQSSAPLVCSLEGFLPDDLKVDITFRVEHLGTLLATLKARGVDRICFCGAVSRPVIDPEMLDAATLPLVPVLMKALTTGDDGALRAILNVFESNGFAVLAAHELVSDLLAPEGVLSMKGPDERMLQDVERADAVLDALGPLDVGQGCVAGAGQIWAIEALGGTDHMLNTLPEGATAAKAVLVKRPKRGQDMRVDVPTVGPNSVKAVAAAGLAGIVVQAGQVLVLARDETIAAADEAGIVFWSRPAS